MKFRLIGLALLIFVTSTFAQETHFVAGVTHVYHTDRDEGKDVTPLILGVKEVWGNDTKFETSIGGYFVSSDSHGCPMAVLFGDAEYKPVDFFASYLRVGPVYKCFS